MNAPMIYQAVRMIAERSSYHSKKGNHEAANAYYSALDILLAAIKEDQATLDQFDYYKGGDRND